MRRMKGIFDAFRAQKTVFVLSISAITAEKTTYFTMFNTFYLYKRLMSNAVDRTSSAKGLTLFKIHIISFIPNGLSILLLLHSRFWFWIEESISNEVHIIILVGLYEMSQVEKHCFLSARWTHYFIFGFNCWGVFNSKKWVSAGKARGVRAAKVDRFDGSAETERTLVVLHNG